MNLKEIRDDVRSLIIEPTPGFRSNEELNRWINQAHQELAMHYRLEARHEFHTEPGRVFYPSPDDMLFLKGAWKTTGEAIPVVPATSGSDLLDRENGDDLTIMHFGSEFSILPEQRLEEGQIAVTLLYERLPRQLRNDEDEPEIAEPYHRYLVSYAVARALAKDEDYEAAAVYMAEYDSALQEIAGHKVPISKDADRVLELARAGILNAAEAAEWLNLPMKRKVWQRVEVEEKGLVLLSTGAISKSDLIKNTEFTDHEKIKERLEYSLKDFVTLPSWDGERRGE